jgi:hypothetical protein
VEKYGTAGQATDAIIIRRMRFACRINKATDTHSAYVILIAFRWQLRLQEWASMLRPVLQYYPSIHVLFTVVSFLQTFLKNKIN